MSSETAPLTFAQSELDLMKQKFSKLLAVEFDAFLCAAKRYQLNPLANQIYARLQERTEKNPRSVTYMAQIDGYRLIADRTGVYAGNDDPVYDNEQHPKKATVTVYKIVEGQRCPFTASARWDQYFPGERQGFMWKKMPHLMLGKCAEALALRKAFPAELSGLYIAEEMHQADTPAPEPEQKNDADTIIDTAREGFEKCASAKAAIARISMIAAQDIQVFGGKPETRTACIFSWRDVAKAKNWPADAIAKLEEHSHNVSAENLEAEEDAHELTMEPVEA